MEYRNKTILAPMVRVGTLPMRMLAADYGADITYGEEIVDHKIVTCRREINKALGTVDLVESATGIVVFRTCEEERQRVVFQIGTSDAVRALKAAELVCRDVAAVDINMGCPRAFSLSGGMGAALLAKPDLIHDILTTLRRNLSVPVTCKIRLLKTRHETVELARMIETTGVAALAVHGRQVPDRPKTPAKLEEIAAVAAALSIPVIANGDAFEYADFARIRSATRAAAVMVGRAAMWNPSVFRREGLVPWEQTKREYVRKAVEWDNEVKGTKHTLREMIMHHSNLEMAEGQRMYKCKTMADLCDMYDVRAYYDGVVAQRSSTSALLARQPGSVVKTFDSLQLDSDLASLKSCAAKLSPGGGVQNSARTAHEQPIPLQSLQITRRAHLLC